MSVRVCVFAFAVTARAVLGGPPPDRSDRVSPEGIAKFVAGLGDASYDTRTVAFRQLCVIGVDAREALEKAAEGSDAEASIRATQILSIFEQLLFAGCEVTIEFSKQDIAWTDPVDLRITIVNHSRYEAQIPFDRPGGSKPTLEGDARQVADMLDASELVRVRAGDGRELELRMDDIAGDEQVAQALQSRLDIHTTSSLAAGETVHITIREFNRGWARYAMLDAGEYTVVLDYTPEWQDSALLVARAGRVVSNIARLKIRDGAPPNISRGGSQPGIVVEQVADAFIAKIENRTDQPVVVNANFGGSAPFADGRWTVESDEHRIDVGALTQIAPTWKDFAAEKLLKVAPGATVELSRVPVAKLCQASKEAAPGGSTGWTVRFAYSNLCDRNWQVRQGDSFAKDAQVPAVLKQPLSRRLLNTRIISERVPLSSGE